MDKIDMMPCNQAADLLDGLSQDVAPEMKDPLCRMASELRAASIAFEASEFPPSLRREFGEALMWHSLILQVIGNSKALETLELPDVGPETRRLMEESGLISAAQGQGALEECKRLSNAISRIGIKMMDAQG